MTINYCCKSFNEAYKDGVIGKDKDKKEENKEKLYLMDRDCEIVSVDEPIKFCPYCGKELDILGGLRELFEH